MHKHKDCMVINNINQVESSHSKGARTANKWQAAKTGTLASSYNRHTGKQLQQVDQQAAATGTLGSSQNRHIEMQLKLTCWKAATAERQEQLKKACRQAAGQHASKPTQ